MEDYKAFLCAYISFLEKVIYNKTGMTSPELIYKFCNDVIDVLSEEEQKVGVKMVRVILFSIILFFILDFGWYLFKKYACYEDYKNYIDYMKRCK